MPSNLNNARSAKKDEFYTQLSDVEKEMRHYKDHFRGKIIYCNCDDPRESAFFKYFSLNFEHLGLKRLIASCYKSRSRDFFSKNDSEKAIWIAYDGDKDGDRLPTVDEMTIHEFEGDGDFRSSESIALLEMADIVVTNPPFSLFREYISQLMEYEKDFIVIGNMNAIVYKETWPLIRENKVWLGMSPRSMTFNTPDDGPKCVNACWYTNLSHSKRNKEMILVSKYHGNEDEYPKYDNYDAINVDKVKNIPCDYYGVIGVPVTFIENYCPSQFEMIAPTCITPEVYDLQLDNKGRRQMPIVNGKRKFERILIRRKHP